MRTFTPQTLSAIDDLAFRVAAGGVDVDRAGVAQVVRRATQAGASPVLTEVVVDPRQPAVARQRAFGQLLTLLDRGTHRAAVGATSDAAEAGAYAWPVRAA